MERSPQTLGQWAVIDIETTGVDPAQDDVIDVGFLQFEGTQLIRRYSSLVRSEHRLSQFIQKLTGIRQQDIQKAPVWSSVETEVQDLYGHTLVAHNADFERSFLESSFERISDGSPRERYEDSLYMLGVLAPWESSLKLENFLTNWGIAESERHRGLADSEDLLKVMLVGTRLLQENRLRHGALENLLVQHDLKSSWMSRFLFLSPAELNEIAQALDWDFDEAVKKARESIAQSAPLRSDEGHKKGTHVQSFEFSGENIKEIFRDEEGMKQTFPEYRYRPSQETLSLRTGQAFKNHVHALVQAPTGTGKTLGYLLPAALLSLENSEQVLVATGTKTLQEQALKKDVPQLYSLLGLSPDEFKVAPLMGSQNHLCELLFRQQLAENSDGGEGDLFSQNKDFEGKFTNFYFDWIFSYNAENPENPVLRRDLPYIFKRKLDNFRERDEEVAVDFRSCTGNKCPFKNECTYLQGLRRAKEADLIIGNHSLMFNWPRSFSRPQYIVVDEAHRIENESTKAFSYQVTLEDFNSLNRNLIHLQGLGSLFYLLSQKEKEEGESTKTIQHLKELAQRTQQSLTDHLSPLNDLIENYFKKRPRYTDIFWNEAPMIDPKKQQGDALAQSIYNHLDSLRHILMGLLEPLLGYNSRWEAKDLESEQEIVALTRFETFVGHLEDIYRSLEVSLEQDKSFAHSLCFHESHGFLLQSSPIDVGKFLHEGLLENAESVVFTSATLGNAEGDKGTKGIEWATGYTYLENSRRFRSGFFLPPVYDYANRTKVFLCDDVPNLHAPDFVEKSLGPVMTLIREMGGRSLLLFSAKTRFEQAREILLNEFEGEIPLFIQGMGNQVVEEFKRSGRGILLGMESFGEGIDVPGDALQFVFIDKIPDLRMDYVVQERRDFYQANLGNEFVDYYLAHRSRALHQKLGRLLRTEKDVGGVIVVDGRIRRWKGRTVEKFMELMKPYGIRRSPLKEACEDIKEFLIEHGGPESDSIPSDLETSPELSSRSDL